MTIAIKRVKKKCRKGIKEIERLLQKVNLSDKEKEHIKFCIRVYKKALNIYDFKTPEPSVLLFCSIIEGTGRFTKHKSEGHMNRFINTIVDAYCPSPNKQYFPTAVIDETLRRHNMGRERLSQWSDNETNTALDLFKELLTDVYREYRCGFTHGMKPLSFEVILMSGVGLYTKPVRNGSKIRLRMTVNELAEITLIVLRDFVKRRVNNQ